MLTRFGFAPRRPGMTIEAFQAHWRTTHAELIGRLPGITRYWQNHAVLRGGSPVLPWPGFDACSEIDAADGAAFEAMFASPEYRGPGHADEAAFVDSTRGASVVTVRTLAAGETGAAGRPGAGARLLVLMRASPQAPAGAVGAALRDGGRGRGSSGREVFEAIDDRGGGPGPVFDAVESLWFGSHSAAEEYLASAHARADREALAGLVAGTERLLCEVVVVVR